MKNVKVCLDNGFGFAETAVKTVYDADKAKQHKQEFDSAVAKFEEEATKRDKHQLVAGICAAIVFMGALVVTKMASWVIALGLVSCILIRLYEGISQWLEETYKPSDKYTPDIEYYLATDDKRVLSITVEPPFSTYSFVRIVTENADHSIAKTEIVFKVVEKTDLHHIVLDVNEGVVYVPYDRKKERESNG